MADGHLNKCIDCTKRDVKVRELKLKQIDPNWGSKERLRHRIKYQKYKYKPNKQSHNISAKKWRNKNIEKRKVHALVGRAIKNGKINKPLNCDGCGAKGRIEAHHEDYNKPFVIKWLCMVCHGKTKRKDQ